MGLAGAIRWGPSLTAFLEASGRTEAPERERTPPVNLSYFETLEQWFSNFGTSASPGGLVTPQMVGPHPRVSDALGLGWNLRICVSNKFLGDADTAGPGTSF